MDTFKFCSEKQCVKTFIDTKFKASLFTPCRGIGGLEVKLHLFLACSQDGGEWSNLHSGSLRRGNPRYSDGTDDSHIQLLQDRVHMWSAERSNEL